MLKYMVITALGEDRPGIVNDITRNILEKDCNVVDSSMSVLGGHFAIICLVSGQWNNLAKLESSIKEIEKKLSMTIIAKYTESKKNSEKLVPYIIDVVSIDHPGIVHNLANFFSNKKINIENIDTSTYSAAHTGTQMFAMNMTINIPANIQISTIREEFIDFCDDLNLDTTFEPLKR